uniref:Uncharacterized protein n=1 Tax=Anguilla anguilla TaxID=7936 RepID=A0A0E9XLX4_ANGAN
MQTGRHTHAKCSCQLITVTDIKCRIKCSVIYCIKVHQTCADSALYSLQQSSNPALRK